MTTPPALPEPRPFDIRVGDCMETMRAMPAESVDAVVCDPPYGIDFMGKAWDRPGDMVGTATGISGGFQKFPPGVKRPEYKRSDPQVFQSWCEAWAVEALRVLKPGGHMLAFGGTRMAHRLAAGIEDAGFEIRDSIAWMYGSGFPKSLDVSKAIDKAAGAEREVGTPGRYSARRPRDETESVNAYGDGVGDAGSALVTAPATPEAEQWEGWGTALKPAHEPIVVARKPLGGTVAACVLEHGTGALNIDASRIDAGGEQYTTPGGEPVTTNVAFGHGLGVGNAQHDGGRWPANVILDDTTAAILDEQADLEASRFFYVAKPSRAERNAGLVNPGPARKMGEHVSGINGADLRPTGSNVHPTVKPIQLMRYLVRLVTPTGGVVLDPFAGSGTTGIAALLEGGLTFIGCEQDASYAAIARDRIRWWNALPADEADTLAAPPAAAIAEPIQLGLLDAIA